MGILAAGCMVIMFSLGCICGMKLSANSQKTDISAATFIDNGEADGNSANHTARDEASENSGKTAAEIAAALNDVPEAEVSAPVDYTYDEAISVLSRMAESDSRYRTIVDHAEDYLPKLLIHLANNPEILSFVVDYDELSEGSTEAVLTEEELAAKCPLFLQWDKRWGAHSYGDESNIAVSGCGPTALAMAIVALTGNADATPADVADFAMSEGYYMSGTGTRWGLMTDGAASYGLDSELIDDADESAIKACLDAGELVICSMREGDFTTGGHFILLYDYDTEGFSLNDPFCVCRSGKKWTYESLEGQIKAAWAVYAR